LAGLNKSPNGVRHRARSVAIARCCDEGKISPVDERIVYMVGKARRNLGTMDLVVFPEYSLHGLSMDTNPDIMCRLDGPKSPRSKQPASTTRSGAAFRSWNSTPTATL